MLRPESTLVTTIVLALLAVSSQATIAAPHIGIEVGEPQRKVVDGPDDDGDLEVSFKVEVKNTSDNDVEVELVISGLDRDNFELFDAILSGNVKGGRTRVLTDTHYIKQRAYNLMTRWHVEEVTVRGEHPNNAVQPSAGAALHGRPLLECHFSAGIASSIKTLGGAKVQPNNRMQAPACAVVMGNKGTRRAGARRA